MWNSHWVASAAHVIPATAPRLKYWIAPHLTDAETEAQRSQVPRAHAHAANTGGFQSRNRRRQGQRSGPLCALTALVLGTEWPASTAGTARASRRPPPCWGRSGYPSHPAAAQGRARAPGQPPPSPAPAPRAARLPCAGPRAVAAASRIPKARSSESTGAGQRVRPPPRPRIPPESLSGLRPRGRPAPRRAQSCGKRRAGRGGAGAGPPCEAGPSAGRGRRGAPP